MPRSAKDEARTGPEGRTPDRIVDGVLDLWEKSGNTALSVRALAQAVEVPPSGIHYHFGNLEGLLETAQQVAIDRAEQWCARQIGDIPAGPPEPEDPGGARLAPILAALIERWCHEQRALAFAWRECQLLAGRNPAFLPLVRRWDALWQRFWTEVCTRCARPEAGAMTAWLFDGESILHMASGARLLDRACLDELCRGWEGWIGGERVPEGHWRGIARAEALRTLPPPAESDAATALMAEAAAGIVAELGAARLTHRAVAARAGVTLGMVSHRFRTSSDLLRSAFETIYRRLAPQDTASVQAHVDAALAEPGGAPSYPVIPQGMTDTHMLALTELVMAVARDADLHRFAHQLRYLRGRTSLHFVQAIGGGPVSTLDAALFSSLAAGAQRAQIGLPEEQRQTMVRRMTRAVATWTGRPGA